MIKRIFMAVIIAITALCAHAQSISPDDNTEYCPLVDVTFTVTLPRIADNTTPTIASWTNTPIVVSGVSNLTNTQTQTTFTFVGRFRDANINQVFRITYQTNSNPNGVKDFEFKHIKSLALGNNVSQTCLPIQTNQSSVTVPRCQNVNIPISFQNVKWSTFGEGSDFCWGTITTYEYQLPLGWTLNGTTSTGSNWIAGSNSVTITSDLSNGDRGVIRIRPSNNCGTGLSNGQTPVGINISRPAPTLSITNPQNQNYICSGSTNYIINGMPAGASVQWSVSDPGLAQITSGGSTSSVTVSRVGSSNGEIILTATVTHCTFTYQVSKPVAIGAGLPPSLTNLNFDRRCGTFMESYSSNPTAATGYVWNLNFGQVVQDKDGYGSDYFYVNPLINSPQTGQSYYNYISVQAKNACGVSDPSETRQFTVGPVPSRCGSGDGTCQTGCPNCCPILLRVSPNPSSDNMMVETTNNSTFTKLRIIDKMGNVKKEISYPVGTRKVSLTISNLPADVYRLQATDGKNWATVSFSKQ